MISRPAPNLGPLFDQPKPRFHGLVRKLKTVKADEAREQGAVAAEACEGAAERKGFDSAGAAKFMHDWLVRHGPTSGEALVNLAKGAGFVPPDDRAFGGTFARLIHRKLIRQVGTAEREKGHGTAGARVWEAVAQP